MCSRIVVRMNSSLYHFMYLSVCAGFVVKNSHLQNHPSWTYVLVGFEDCCRSWRLLCNFMVILGCYRTLQKTLCKDPTVDKEEIFE